MNAIINDVNRRQEFVLLFDVKDGNPNGDPDAGNLPRVDPETMQGLVTDVCIKRKVRNFVDMTIGKEEGMRIYVQNKGFALNDLHQEAYDDLKIKSTGTKQKRDEVERTQSWMCKNFYDVRMFGAVMTTGVNCGQVRGPVQLSFARSINQVVPLDISITRVAITKSEDAKVVETDAAATGGKRTEMGRKALLPYGLYKAYGFITPHFAQDTGVSEADLELFWSALQNMWDLDRSASRGMMACRGIYIFTHESTIGNAPAHELLERVKVTRKEDVESARSFDDYIVSVNDNNLPEGVKLSAIGV
ncbi:MAG: type I-C CRISPR-associated protein Cas7/Csd2 [Gaiellales bacterium]|nr:MAG: type I-C CRISPR-associated protein Cas7/Csd2 [Gaiellales bacterium]